MNLWDWIILFVIAAALGLALFHLIRNRRRGLSSCGCSTGCTGLPDCPECRKRAES